MAWNLGERDRERNISDDGMYIDGAIYISWEHLNDGHLIFLIGAKETDDINRCSVTSKRMGSTVINKLVDVSNSCLDGVPKLGYFIL